MTNVPIILVAFGAMSNSARKVYLQFELDVRSRFPGHRIIWAYTAKSLIARLRQQGKRIQSLSDVYASLRTDGFQSAIVQSLHLTPGCKHGTVVNENSQGLNIAIGKTLLETKEDIQEVASELLKKLTMDKPVMIVAHGNASEDRFNIHLRTLGKIISNNNPNFCFTCLEGAQDMGELQQFKKIVQTAGKVHVCPFLLVNGRHVAFDILGSHINSIKSYLSVDDFVCGEVLGKQKWVRHRFLNNISIAINKLEEA
jgi:sirohydrochlorin cobaltochelatase